MSDFAVGVLPPLFLKLRALESCPNDSQLKTQQGYLRVFLVVTHLFGCCEINQAGQEVCCDRVGHRHLIPLLAIAGKTVADLERGVLSFIRS